MLRPKASRTNTIRVLRRNRNNPCSSNISLINLYKGSATESLALELKCIH